MVSSSPGKLVGSTKSRVRFVLASYLCECVSEALIETDKDFEKILPHSRGFGQTRTRYDHGKRFLTTSQLTVSDLGSEVVVGVCHANSTSAPNPHATLPVTLNTINLTLASISDQIHYL